MNTVHDRASAHNAEERDLRAELGLLRARYDGGAVNPAVFTVVKAIETELAWLEHRGRP